MINIVDELFDIVIKKGCNDEHYIIFIGDIIAKRMAKELAIDPEQINDAFKDTAGTGYVGEICGAKVRATNEIGGDEIVICNVDAIQHERGDITNIATYGRTINNLDGMELFRLLCVGEEECLVNEGIHGTGVTCVQPIGELVKTIEKLNDVTQYTTAATNYDVAHFNTYNTVWGNDTTAATTGTGRVPYTVTTKDATVVQYTPIHDDIGHTPFYLCEDMQKYQKNINKNTNETEVPDVDIDEKGLMDLISRKGKIV